MADLELEEYKQLQAMVSQLEVAMSANPEKRPVLSAAVDKMRARLADLEKKIKEKEEQAQEQKAGDMASQQAIEKETALNAQEKEAYGGFLKEDFFTKKDFGALDKFYSHTWEKLSEDGKSEMSYRVWEGVRHHEYKFSELPGAVREKEAARVYGALERDDRTKVQPDLISSADRQDFINARKAGDKESSYKILDREGFSQAVSKAKPEMIKHSAPEQGKDADTAVLGKSRDGTISHVERSSTLNQKTVQEMSFNAASLTGVKVHDVAEAVKPNVPLVSDASARSL